MATGILGLDTLGTLTLGAGPNYFTDDIVEVAYLLAIEGIADMFVTDHTGDVLLGSGSLSWIGQYEQDSEYTAHETVGQRVVRGGLKWPRQIPRGRLNPKTGQLETTQLTFDLIDVDGILPTLFASEGKDFSVLGQRVAPGTSAVASSLAIEGSDTIDPLGMYLGIERIGPARERAWFYPLPFQGIGYHHQVNRNAQELTSGPPPVRISAGNEPLEFAGRKVVLYKLYRNNADATASYTDWAHWGDQYKLGPPEFVGVMRDVGEYGGDSTWKVSCFGFESLLRRRMGTYDIGWQTLTRADTSLTTDERGIAVAFYTINGSDAQTVYNSTVFGTATLSATGTKASYVTEISTAAQNAFDGTTGDFGTNDMATENFSSAVDCELEVNQSRVRLKRSGTGTTAMVVMILCMHERAWRTWGFEPALQKVGWAYASSDDREVVFWQLDSGQAYFDGASGIGSVDGAETPGPGYWAAAFHTREKGFAPNDPDDDSKNNDGDWRTFKPLYPSKPIILAVPPADQTIAFDATFPYVERDPTVDSGAYSAGRYFVFRGKRFVGSISDTGEIFNEDGSLADDVEANDFAAIAEVHWNYNGSDYGSVDESGASGFELHVHDWKDGKRFGAPYASLPASGEWAALASGEYSIQLAPLHAYACREVADANERAWQVFGQILLSTGTASGWSGGNYVEGTNAPPTSTGSLYWINDITSSELGLGVPYQLVQDPADILAAFDDVPGGAHGSLNRVRYCFSEPFDSRDLLEEILRTRGLAFSLRGGRVGAVRLGLFEPDLVDHVIDESSVHVDVEDPSSENTTQQLRATGGVDYITLNYQRDPSSGEMVGELSMPAKDAGARFRRGDLVEDLADSGLRENGAWLGQFRELHQKERAEFLNKRHFVISTTLHRVAGQHMWPGDRVSFTSERCYTAAGVLGMTAAIGHVLSVVARPHSEGEVYDVELLVYAGQVRLSLFAPIGKVAQPSGISGTSVNLLTDWAGHAEGVDAARFVRPSWLSSGTGLRVCLLEYDRFRWTLHSSDTAVVVSRAANTITLDGAFSNPIHRTRDYWLVPVGYDAQAADSWARDVLLPYVLDSKEFGSGPTDGWPYLEG